MAPDFSTRIAANVRRIKDYEPDCPPDDDDLRQLEEAAWWIETLQRRVETRTQELINAGARYRRLEDRVHELEARLGIETPVLAQAAVDTSRGEV